MSAGCKTNRVEPSQEPDRPMDRFNGMARFRSIFFAAALALSVLLPARVVAQDSIGIPVIQGLRAVQVGENVQLDWFIPEGLSCIDMQVQRIGPDTDFETQNTVFGICGSDDSDAFYDYTDTDPLLPNLTYGWRIYASNGTVVSDTVFLDFLGTSNTLQVGPNPLTGTGYAWFNNASGERVRLEWWDMQGRLVRTSTYAVQRRFALDRGGLESGTYIITIRTASDEVLAQRRIQLP